MSKKGLKIVTIGGGSSYTPELVEGLIKRYSELPVAEYWLVDIEEGKEKLEIVGALAKRMVEKAGVPMEIHLTLDRKEALKDAVLKGAFENLYECFYKSILNSFSTLSDFTF